MFLQQHTSQGLQQYGIKALLVDNSFLESLLSPTYLQVPDTVNQRIGSCFDQLPDSTQSQILNAFLLQYENICPILRLRFLQLIQPRDFSVRELIRWIWDRCIWEQTTRDSEHPHWKHITQDSWSLCVQYSWLTTSPWKSANDYSHESDMSEKCCSKLSTHKRKRKDDPWYSMIKSMKSNSLSPDYSEGVIRMVRNTSLDQLIVYWKDWFVKKDRGSLDSKDDGVWICLIGNDILDSYEECRGDENIYSICHLVAVISYLFVPFIARLRFGASRQVLLLLIEWAKKWPLLIQQYFVLPLLCKHDALEAPQVEVIGKVAQNSFSSYLIQDSMKHWLTQSIQPWNESILVLLEQWLPQVNDANIIFILIGQLEANAPFVELSPKWIKLLYDLCQQHLSICLEYRHILRRCLVTTSSYLTEKCLALLTNGKPLE
ncbi:hypothetical protein GpartN1_g6997.t1 [Galdieria partita]|uniref:Uncharacterized protein n=1 Tax=Galdieria partita TaxID=83374 RepID=A0A9C7UTB5_9RHOD|nr:hypothetical protein GpartN1_g6499.t1 [Galdieria partita]GJQ15206.1 hypothetical protein GpartN1_g6997.t1 [Galdieria partita]